jgi:hypothetical protein
MVNTEKCTTFETTIAQEYSTHLVTSFSYLPANTGVVYDYQNAKQHLLQGHVKTPILISSVTQSQRQLRPLINDGL